MELAAGEHGTLPLTPRSSAQPTDEKSATRWRQGAVRTRTPDKLATPVGPSRATPAPSESGPCSRLGVHGSRRDPAHPSGPGADAITFKGPQHAAGGPPDSTSQHGPATTRARRPRAPGEHTRSPRTRTDTATKTLAATRGHGTRTARAAPVRPGTKRKRYPNQTTAADPQPTPAHHCQARRTTRCKDAHPGRTTGPPDQAGHGNTDPKWATVSDSSHRCRSSADPGPPLPGPADHELQGLSFGPATRPYAGCR